MRAKGRWLSFVSLLFLASTVAHAGGPRWYTGPPFYTAPWSVPVTFYTMSPMYYTDAGDLNASVTHAQADAMVAAAAAVWNVPTSRVTLAQGGTLREHVSSANVYFDGKNMVFPADVQATNYHAVPIAIVYDTDGSVIDTLLGSGASEPSGCRQNGVVESVDAFDSGAGTIDHALLILNGRCVGANADQLLQMQYQLARKFGRVLGLGWSQLNDDVFTGVTAPNALELQYWPLMHPIDVICGPYTYKCMTQPFTLRPDDLSTLALMYPVTSINITPEKALTGANAMQAIGDIHFATGQGMGGVNAVARRALADGTYREDAEIVSALTGILFQQVADNPVTGAASGVDESSGGPYATIEGRFQMMRIPILPQGIMGITLTTEPVNPLYTGDYALAPYPGSAPTPSGVAATYANGYVGANFVVVMDATPAGSAAVCSPGGDGVEASPAAIDASGWWAGQLCGNGHVSWGSQTVKAGRSWTLEVTAVDESGTATTGKLHPLIGVWNAADAAGTLPTMAATAAPFNAPAAGMTRLLMASSSGSQSWRFAIADDRGKGRPDFGYKSRLLYVDSVTPATVSGAGGQVIITGMGFKTGNRVTVNGVAATVTSWTANVIVATLPSRTAANIAAGVMADVAVIDPGTGGSSVISGAVQYDGTAAPDRLTLVSAPSQVETGIASGTAFSVRLTGPDGVTPLSGAGLRLAMTAGSGTFSACGGAVCTLTTNAAGVASSSFTAGAAGSLTLTATEVAGSATLSVNLTATDPVRTASASSVPRYLAAGAAAAWTFTVIATQDGAAVAGTPVTWSTSGSGLTAGATGGLTDANGTASVTVSTQGLAAGAAAAVQGCVWNTVCASATVYGVGASEWTPAVASGAGQSVPAAATLQPVVLRVTDAALHPLQGAAVNVYQTVTAWEGACAVGGRCAATPVLASSRTSLTTDASGLVIITPLEVSGVASVVNVAVSTGTQGFVSLALVKTP